MNAEQHPKLAATPETGRFATLSSLLPAKGTGAPSLRLLAILTLAATAAIASIAPSLAQAHQARLFSSSFGAATSTPANPYPLGSAAGNTAVDASSHDLYVSDVFNHRVEKFGPAGEFLFMIGDEVNSGTGNPDLCTNAGAPTDICQAGTANTSPGGFQSFDLPLAVDNSPGGEGDLYVGDRTGQLVSKFDSDGHLITSWGNNGPLETPNGQLNGANATAPIAGSFDVVEGVAVDLSGNLWVYAGATVFEFHQDGSFAENDWNAFSSAGAIAVDSEDNLYFGHGHVPKYNATGTPLGNVFGGSNEETTTSLAVDPSTDELYLGVNLGNSVLTFAVQRFDSSCHPSPEYGAPPCAPVESFDAGRGGINGLTLDPSTHALYAAETESKDGLTPAQVRVFAIQTVPDVLTAKATGFSATTATLNGSVNPDGVPLTECLFEWGETTAYGNSAECEPNAAALGSGKSPLAVHADIAGLEAGHTYHFRLVAANANDVNSLINQPERGADLAFGPPTLESASALDVAATGAKLQAQVNPNNVDTSTRIEYVTQAQFELNGFSEALSTAETNLGSGGSSQSATFEISGLTPATTYRYHALAESPLGAVEGPDHVFTTQSTGSLPLPDHRGWELVSPPDKRGGEIQTIRETGVTEAAAGGGAISYIANAPIEADPQGNSGIGVQALSVRGAGGWSSCNIASPHRAVTGSQASPEYRFFAADLSAAVIQPFGLFNPDLSKEATEQTPYLRTLGSCDPSASLYTPLVTAANVPPETRFGEEQKCDPAETEGSSSSAICGPEFLGATDDLGHLVLVSTTPLTPGAAGGQLYEWSGGALQQISLLPPNGAGEEISAPPGSARLGYIFGEQQGTAARAISADGSRVFWSTTGTLKASLYLRDTTLSTTLQLDVGETPCVEAGNCQSGGGVFQNASADGSRVFFTDTNRLTADAGGSGSDLYECRIVEAAGKPTCDLTDLTPEVAGEAAQVERHLLGAGEDGEELYFVARGTLGTSPNKRGESAVQGQANLYVRESGQTSFIATLSPADQSNWEESPVYQPTRVSPSGRYLAFISDRPLSGYDNRDAVSGKLDAEVFLYDAASGRILCASCDPTGARPVGIESGQLASGTIEQALATIRGEREPSTGWVAALLPQAGSSLGQTANLYQSRYLSDSGRLFFNVLGPLVPADSNGVGDVYQFEFPQGPGQPASNTCTTSSPTYSPVSGGCIDLISSGTSKKSSAFVDVSESGDDAFFFTGARLTPKDVDAAGDIYDARVGGGEAPIVNPPACEGDACQAPAVPPNDPTPGSLTSSGAGNILECPKGKVEKSGKCVKQHSKKKHHKKKGKKKQKRANSNRGGQR